MGRITIISELQIRALRRIRVLSSEYAHFENLFYQNCYYILNTTEQLLKFKTPEFFTIVLRHSSETSPMWKIGPLFFRPLVDMWFILLGLHSRWINHIRRRCLKITLTYPAHPGKIVKCPPFYRKITIQKAMLLPKIVKRQNYVDMNQCCINTTYALS